MAWREYPWRYVTSITSTGINSRSVARSCLKYEQVASSMRRQWFQNAIAVAIAKNASKKKKRIDIEHEEFRVPIYIYIFFLHKFLKTSYIHKFTSFIPHIILKNRYEFLYILQKNWTFFISNFAFIVVQNCQSKLL